MPPRPLASLALSLGAAPDLDAALLALGETLSELDRGAQVVLFPYDARRELLRERVAPTASGIARVTAEASLEHLPTAVRQTLLGGARFVELGERSPDYGRLLGFTTPMDGTLSLRGVVIEGHLVSVLALLEPRRIFGARVLDRFAPAVELFELCVARFWEREAREEAVRTLEEVTQQVHGAYVRRLAQLERALDAARRTPAAGMDGLPLDAPAPPEDPRAERLAAERLAAQQAESVRRAERRAQRLEEQAAAVAVTLEQTQVELLRRGEALRQTERTLYLIDRVLSLDAAAHDPRQLVDGLLALVGDDMQAQRCSLMLRAPEPDNLYLAAARGLSPHITEGARVRMGEGVAGKVAASREPMLVRDVRDAGSHPLLHDQYFTSGSFISFPLIYHDELVGVVNLTNRATQAGYTDADVERVRLLALVIALVATHARLPERLVAHLEVA
jgi:predicted regulator of Ras-like GTPase activity (Roadblock/LC7/MglB family)